MGRGLDGYFDIFEVALCSCERPPRNREVSRLFRWLWRGGNTSSPIPNRAVKPLSADGTWSSRARESRTPPL